MARKVVLLVDDDKEFLSELREALASCGYVPVAVSRGADALKTARKLRPGVILLDLRLGSENGLTIARGLRKDPATAGTPIIMMSGNFTGKDREEFLSGPAINIFLGKPFSQRDIVRSIQTALAEKEEELEKSGGFKQAKRLIITAGKKRDHGVKTCK